MTDKKNKEFDPNGVASKNAGIFGLTYSLKASELVILPVPWDATVSYSAGTAKGPKAVFDASMQVDLLEPIFPNAWKKGITMIPINKQLHNKSDLLRKKVLLQIDAQEEGKSLPNIVAKVNETCSQMNNWVYDQCINLLNQNKLVGLLGGDHSTPLGYIQALSTIYPSFGILQIDAHCDLRNAYEGFTYSHASVMFNALKVKQVSKLVQVGIRDFCEEENDLINKSKNRIETFFDAKLKKNAIEGMNWKKQCELIVATLPKHVYISFDIDGLDPKLCPNTGTPVPGGLEFEQAIYLFEMLISKGKNIIGFDLNEVAPGKNEWDANVGARLLFKLSHLLFKGNNAKLKNK
jgi:agmatinase